MNFITILSIFLITSFQFSSLVSGDSSYGSEYGLTQISTSKTTNKNGRLSTITRSGYLFGKRDHKEKDHKEKDHKEKEHKNHSDENSEEVTTKVTTEKTTEPIGIVKGTNLICEYCG